MAKNYYQDGSTMDWHNGTSKDVVSGQPVIVGALIGIAQHDIPVDADGVLMMAGVFTLPKVVAGTWQRGVRLWLTKDDKLTSDEKDGSDTNAFAGTAWITTNPNDSEGRVRLGF
jgi:predicted RecA/RadA family phage recombinase